MINHHCHTFLCMSYCHDHVITITRYVTSRHKCWPTSLVSGNHITHNLILICHVIMSSENKNVWFNLIYLLWPCKFPFTYHVVMQCSLSQCKKVFLPSEHVLNVGVYSYYHNPIVFCTVGPLVTFYSHFLTTKRMVWIKDIWHQKHFERDWYYSYGNLFSPQV